MKNELLHKVVSIYTIARGNYLRVTLSIFYNVILLRYAWFIVAEVHLVSCHT